MEFDKIEFRKYFKELTGDYPYPYQICAAQALSRGKNLVLNVPTGAGKTLAVLAPFFFMKKKGGPSRLIYALPLRTLVQGVYRTIDEILNKQQLVDEVVKIQTGEQPDDPFFTLGSVTVTTYDQVLSGTLGGPYGLSNRLRNINAASTIGSMVVFDEFHLMPADKAFLTGVAISQLFKGFHQSVWMTATATSPLITMLNDALDSRVISLSENEMKALPSISLVKREMVTEGKPLSAAHILRFLEGRSIVILNTVERAQKVFSEIRLGLREKNLEIPVMLLHSRFFKNDRREKEGRLSKQFGKGCHSPSILVATQVVEAGLDISCEHLHTEVCPVSSLVQRAGRCARYPGESGVVHVYDLPEAEHAWLPYGDVKTEEPALTRTKALLSGISSSRLTPTVIGEWVEAVHCEDDARLVREGWRSRRQECLERISKNIFNRENIRVADLIRGDENEQVRVILEKEALLLKSPAEREGVSLYRNGIRRLLIPGRPSPGWFWDLTQDEPAWKPLLTNNDLNSAYVICLKPDSAAYNRDSGLRLGEVGNEVSPVRLPPARPGYKALNAEAWLTHAENVARVCATRFDSEISKNSATGGCFLTCYNISREQLRALVILSGQLHDLGKLSHRWQEWAEDTQRRIDVSKLVQMPLAHTDSPPAGGLHSSGENSVSRPPHAAASAFIIRICYPYLAKNLPGGISAELISACAAAVISHHGGWLAETIELDVLAEKWRGCFEAFMSEINEASLLKAMRCTGQQKKDVVEELLKCTTHPDKLPQFWPLVAYLVRTLRLSDQDATAEGGSEDENRPGN